MSKEDNRPPQKGRYRKIEVRMWGDERFRGLTPMPPCGQGLWVFLLTGPHTGPIPGLFRAGRAAMAEELDWDLEAFDEAFAEAFQQGMVEADWKAKVVWIPNAIHCNRPESPNVVTSWGSEWDLIPECDLKREAYEVLKASISALGEGFGKAFGKAFNKPREKPTPKTMPNQEQEQEQEQEVLPSTGRAVALTVVPKKSKPQTSTTPTAETWAAYAEAYRQRYSVDPVRNGTVNGQLSNFVKRIGADEAPAVAAFFVWHNARYYVGAMHSVSALLKDAEKLRTEWVTGQRMTAAQADQSDKTQTNAEVFGKLIEEARRAQG